ncbi:MAG: ADP-ribosylglycohydrolase family protein [Saprospiraceae bacterium]
MKIEDLLIGIAIGDAFGAGVEFQDRDWVRANVDFSKFINARGEIKIEEERKKIFTQNYSPWDYTDDTEMTIGVIKALLSKKTFSENLLVEKWTEEYQKGILKKGFGRNGHGSMSWYFNGEKTVDEIRDFQRDRFNPGNAPAMRSVPLGLVNEKLINDFAKINADATHPNINAIISSQCIARATEFLLVKKGETKDVIQYCKNHISLNEEYEKYFNKIEKLGSYENLTDSDFEILCGTQPIPKPYFLSGIKGVPSDSKFTTGSVLYILKNSENAFDALRKSVWLGGDVDSVASITTGIMAGRFGLESIPNFMLENAEGVPYLKQIAKAFENKLNNESRKI